jgi:hypothetical protein
VLPLRIFLSLAGCTPTCEQVCEKLVECENEGTERMTAFECEESCSDQQDLLDRWTDEEKRDAFDAQLVCLNDEECDAIAAGACYDAEVWSF